MGFKPPDWCAISLCGGPEGHHSEQHRIGERSFQEKYAIDMQALADEFAKASPKAAEIRKEKAGNG